VKSLGYVLYDCYIKANAREDCEVDSWDELSDMDKRVWERMGEAFAVALQS
jgi:hypothetical protein